MMLLPGFLPGLLCSLPIYVANRGVVKVDRESKSTTACLFTIQLVRRCTYSIRPGHGYEKREEENTNRVTN